MNIEFLGMAVVVLMTFIFSIYSALTFYQMRDQMRLYQDYLSRFREQLMRQEKEAKELEKKFIDLESIFYDLRQDPHVVAKQEPSGAYKQALKMVAMGASVEDMMESCGMARSEAELLINLQAYKKMKSLA